MRKKWFVGLCATCLCLLGSGFFFGCQEEEQPQVAPPEVKTYTVEVAFSITDSCSTTGGDLTQEVSKNAPFTPIAITPKLGYKVTGYTVDGVTYPSDYIAMQEVEKSTTVTVNVDYATDELPIINIHADGPIESKEEYVDMTFSMENCYTEIKEVTGGIRLRGNSTKTFPKKPYRIKFDKKQSLFGLEKAKSWVLLAEYLDPSAMRNFTALTLGGQSDGLKFTCTPHKVNVYLNGEYIGLYTLCEQVQENEGRVDIETEITSDMVEITDYNFLVCMDEKHLNDVDAEEDVTYVRIKEFNYVMELKYPEKDDFPSEAQFKDFIERLKVYIYDTLKLMNDASEEQVRQKINIKSLIDFNIIDNIMMEYDHAIYSYNMYYTNTSDDPEENGKLNFGPIWDYDFCMNTDWTGKPNEQFEIKADQGILYRNWFARATKRDCFHTEVKERYNRIFKNYLAYLINHIDNMYISMQESLKLNAEKWYGDYTYDITEKNCEFVINFLIARKTYLDEQFA